jgi:hypothetical protein
VLAQQWQRYTDSLFNFAAVRTYSLRNTGMCVLRNLQLTAVRFDSANGDALAAKLNKESMTLLLSSIAAQVQ